MIYILRYDTDKVNAALSTTSSLHPEVNGQVVIPSNQKVKAVTRMPRVMRARLQKRPAWMAIAERQNRHG